MAHFVVHVTPNSSSPLNLPLPPQSSESQPFSLPVLYSSGEVGGGGCARADWPTLWNRGKNDRQQMGPLYHSKRFQDTIQVNSSPFVSSDQTESIFLNVTSLKTGSGKGTRSGNSRLLLPAIPCTKKEWKVTSSYRSFFTDPIHKETTIQDGDNQVRKTIDCEQRLGCLQRLDRFLPSRPDTSSIQKVSSVVYEDQILQFTALPFGMSLSPWIFINLMDIIASHLRQRAISIFPYLDDWLIRDPIRNRLLSQTKYCLQVVQDLGFISN